MSKEYPEKDAFLIYTIPKNHTVYGFMSSMHSIEILLVLPFVFKTQIYESIQYIFHVSTATCRSNLDARCKGLDSVHGFQALYKKTLNLLGKFAFGFITIQTLRIQLNGEVHQTECDL